MSRHPRRVREDPPFIYEGHETRSSTDVTQAVKQQKYCDVLFLYLSEFNHNVYVFMYLAIHKYVYQHSGYYRAQQAIIICTDDIEFKTVAKPLSTALKVAGSIPTWD